MIDNEKLASKEKEKEKVSQVPQQTANASEGRQPKPQSRRKSPPKEEELPTSHAVNPVLRRCRVWPD